MEACSGIFLLSGFTAQAVHVLRLQPALKFFGAYYSDRGSHSVMPQTAQLRADKLVRSKLRCLEVSVDLHSRHRVLLEAHRGNEDTVDHVLGTQDQLHVTPDRQHKRRGNNIVFSRWI